MDPKSILSFPLADEKTMTQRAFLSSILIVTLWMVSGCSEDSSVPNADRCGDRSVTQTERCDDGNTQSGDGCSEDCLTIEAGYVCPPKGGACTKEGDVSKAVCGNGEVEAGESCDDGDVASGDGCSAQCQVEDGYQCPPKGGKCIKTNVEAKCGNSVVEGEETCDDGSRQNGDGCDADCHVEAGYDCPPTGGACTKKRHCGDGILAREDGEECDDGNPRSDDGCSSDCRIERGYVCDKPGQRCHLNTCGNGTQDSGEECDYGDDTVEYTPSPDEALVLCTSWCERPLYCGDGISDDAISIANGEECDEGIFGTPDAYNGCSRTCKRVNYCGDGKVSHQETCDDGNAVSGDGCSATCQVEEGFDCRQQDAEGKSLCEPIKCGNKERDPGEECDDGNRDNGDGCSKLCFVEHGYICDNTEMPSKCVISCGNGILEAISGEKCDDGNKEPGDGCSANCQIESGYIFDDNGELVARACGDGIKAGSEECDDGNTRDEDGCSSRCKREQGWYCDKPGEACHKDVCSDSRVTGDETCDDGNLQSGDGCNSVCQIETGWECLIAGEPCKETAKCGDGILQGAENCEDGNTSSGDGCNSVCQIETGWRCPTLGEACIKGECGNGILEKGEECDDNNLNAGDGCSPICEIEPIYECNDFGCTPVCGDGLVIPGVEECDDGNLVNGDGCSSRCKKETGYTCDVKIASTPGELNLPIVYHDFRNYQRSGTGDGYVSQEIFNALPSECTGGDGASYRYTYYNDTSFRKPNNCSLSGLVVGKPIPDFRGYCPGAHCEKAVLEDLGRDGLPELAPPAMMSLVDRYFDNCPYSCPGLYTCPSVFKWWFKDVEGINKTIKTTIRLTEARCDASVKAPGTYCYQDSAFYPIDGLGYGNDSEGNHHNGEFSSHFQTYFKFNGGEHLIFDGDDDVWVFFNKKLGVDVGGIHPQWKKEIVLTEEVAREQFHMYPGGIYPIDMFHAERCTGGSSFRLTLAGFVAMGTSTCDAICGDGIIRGDEECDYVGIDTDVELQKQKGCSSTCKLQAFCGNGKVEKGEQCDTTESWCKQCKLDPDTCGNGVIDDHEQCDDGRGVNGTAGSNCLETCRITGCGDGIVDTANGEECDDANSSNDDTCTTQCKRPYCGDGIVTPSLGEACDDGKNDGSYNGCGLGCAYEPPKCGDGNIDTDHDEECDDGDRNADNTYNVCSKSCKYGERCGDGVLQTQYGEDCDPAIPGTTGCSQYCTFTIY